MAPGAGRQSHNETCRQRAIRAAGNSMDAVTAQELLQWDFGCAEKHKAESRKQKWGPGPLTTDH